MDLYKIQILKDEQWSVMDEIGKLGALHFLDLNSNNLTDKLYQNDLRTMNRLLMDIG